MKTIPISCESFSKMKTTIMFLNDDCSFFLRSRFMVKFSELTTLKKTTKARLNNYDGSFSIVFLMEWKLIERENTRMKYFLIRFILYLDTDIRHFRLFLKTMDRNFIRASLFNTGQIRSNSRLNGNYCFQHIAIETR